MNLLIAVGLVMQAIALILLFHRLGRTWLTHIGSIFITLAAAYHGLNEVLLWLFPYRNPYRHLVSQDYVSQFVLWVSVAILLFTLAYLAALGRPLETPSQSETLQQRTGIRRVLDWRLMLTAAIPLMALTVAGNGYVSGPSTAFQPLDLGAGLSLQFFLLATVFASLGLIARFGDRWLLPVLLVQSVMVALTNQRLSVLVTAALLLYALARIGISLTRRQMSLVIAAFVLIALVLTSARASEGRISTGAGGDLRLDFLAAGIVHIGSLETRDRVVGDLGYRLDGNSFGAMELQALASGSPSLGLTPLVNDVLLAVPSFLNPDKNLSAIEKRSEKDYAEIYLSLPLPVITPGVREDILPTQLGVTIGYFGPWLMLVIALAIGATFGISDRWVLRRLTPSRLLIGTGLLSCVLHYEGSWETYSVTFRGILLLLPLVLLIQRLRPSFPPEAASPISVPKPQHARVH